MIHYSLISISPLLVLIPHLLPATIIDLSCATIAASWYSTQLFYSKPFYDATVTSSPDDLRDFVDLWLDSYANLTARASASLAGSNITAICQDLPDVDEDNLVSICELVIAYGGDWAAFIKDMLHETSVAFGDADFVTRAASAEGRIGPLRDVDLITQTGMTPTARVVKERSADAYVYVGPTAESYYTTPIPAAYVVTSDDETPINGWWIGPAGSELLVSNPMAPGNSPGFDFSDWESFDLFPPNDNATTTMSRTDAFGRPLSLVKPFQVPFSTSGATSVVQAAATSSALLGSFSGLTPSVFAQSLSLARYRIENDPGLSSVKKNLALRALDGPVSDQLYDSELVFGFSVCSQWPNPCGETDSHFLDGIATDTTALATTVGAYHASPKADLSKPMKVVLTNTNYEWESTGNIQQILMHWSSPLNQDVDPGEFLWLEDYNRQPMQSTQIFSDFMHEEILNLALEEVDGTNFTTAILYGTTIDNPSFSVKAGQEVEVLLININTPIPTLITGPDFIETLKQPMGDMVVEIATNPVLLARVNAFLELGENEVEEEEEGEDMTSSQSDRNVPMNSFVLNAALVIVAYLFY